MAQLLHLHGIPSLHLPRRFSGHPFLSITGRRDRPWLVHSSRYYRPADRWRFAGAETRVASGRDTRRRQQRNGGRSAEVITRGGRRSAGDFLQGCSRATAGGGGGCCRRPVPALVAGLRDAGDLAFATDQMVVLPVLVLAERTTVTRHVTTGAGLACLAPAVPATLSGQAKRKWPWNWQIRFYTSIIVTLIILFILQ